MNHLNEQEKKALTLLKKRLVELFADRLDGLKLFGSKARGEAAKHSDVDVLVVIKDGSWQDSWPVHEAASEVSLQADVDLSVKILTPAAISRLKEQGSPLMSNIEQDGIEI